jgi:integrase
MTALEPVRPDPAALERVEHLRAKAREYVEHSKSEATVRAYAFAWRRFSAWCANEGRSPLPATPETVAVYLADQAPTSALATLVQHMSMIAEYHRTAGYNPPPTQSQEVRLTWQGIRRVHGPDRIIVKATPALMADLARMLEHLPGGLRGIRDRAVLLMGFAGAMRRSEVSGLRISDIEDRHDGLRIRLRKSKTDQTGEDNEIIGLPYSPNPDTCPVRAWRAWRTVLEDAQALENADQFAFRVISAQGTLRPDEPMSDRAVARMVNRYAKLAGLPAGQWSGHSLRSGFVTDAAQKGVLERVIAKQSRHADLPTLRGYIREGDLFRENAAAQVLR